MASVFPSNSYVCWGPASEDTRLLIGSSEGISLFALLLLLSTATYKVEDSFGQIGSTVPTVSSPTFLPTPSLLAVRGKNEEQKRCWCCATTVRQQPKHWCAVNTILVINLKRGIIQAAMRKVNTIPSRPSTGACSFLHWSKELSRSLSM